MCVLSLHQDAHTPKGPRWDSLRLGRPWDCEWSEPGRHGRLFQAGVNQDQPKTSRRGEGAREGEYTVAPKVQTVWGLEGGAAFWPCLPIPHQANRPGAEGLKVALPSDRRALSTSTCPRTDRCQREDLQKGGTLSPMSLAPKRPTTSAPIPPPQRGPDPSAGPRYVLVPMPPLTPAPTPQECLEPEPRPEGVQPCCAASTFRPGR